MYFLKLTKVIKTNLTKKCHSRDLKKISFYLIPSKNLNFLLREKAGFSNIPPHRGIPSYPKMELVGIEGYGIQCIRHSKLLPGSPE